MAFVRPIIYPAAVASVPHIIYPGGPSSTRGDRDLPGGTVIYPAAVASMHPIIYPGGTMINPAAVASVHPSVHPITYPGDRDRRCRRGLRAPHHLPGETVIYAAAVAFTVAFTVI
jgi:hypothetical protein